MCRARKLFIAEHQRAVAWPILEHGSKRGQLCHLGHKCAAALLRRLDGVGDKAGMGQPCRIRKLGLDGQNTPHPELRRLFNDKISPSLLDRGKEQPEVRGQLQRRALPCGAQEAAALACLNNLRLPFTVMPVEERNRAADSHPHHPKEIMRLLPRQRDQLPRLQRVVYVEADLCGHGGEAMRQAGQIPDGQIVDAAPGNWVDHRAPRWARPYLRLSRADRPIGTWLLLIPCWWGLALAMLAGGDARWGDLWIGVACALGAWLMRGAGCTWNDISDREIDAKVARTRSRPLPSGQVSLRGAFLWMGMQSGLALVLLLSFNWTAIWLGVLALLPVAIYPFAKRFTWWPQVFLGLAFNWGALLGWAAHSGSLSAGPIALYLSGIAWTLFYDTIYAHQDIEDDALIGVKSTARLFGAHTHFWLKLFLIATVILMGLAMLAALGAQGIGWALLCALGAPAVMAWHMTRQLRRVDLAIPSSCMQVFRSNRDAGLLALAFFCLALFV